MDLKNVYEDHEKPLKNYKRVVWYNDSTNINRLDELASILGLKQLVICGEKDDENDIAIVKTNNAGNGLILENCHLQIIIKDIHHTVIVKDNDGNKTYYTRGDDNVI